MNNFFRIVLLLTVSFLTGCKTSSTNEYLASQPISPKLVEPIQFDGFVVSEIAGPEEVKRLMNQKLASTSNYYSNNPTNNNETLSDMIRHDGLDFLTLNGRVIRTETVQQYIDAKKNNEVAGGKTTCDMTAEDEMMEIEAKLQLMGKAKSSTKTYLGHDFLRYLPLNVLRNGKSGFGNDEARQIEKCITLAEKSHKTINDFAGVESMDKIFASYEKQGGFEGYHDDFSKIRLSKLDLTDNSLKFLDLNTGFYYLIDVMAYGDFNGDQIEDAVVKVRWKSSGTMNGSYIDVLTRTGPKKNLKFVKVL